MTLFFFFFFLSGGGGIPLFKDRSDFADAHTDLSTDAVTPLNI